MKTIRKIFSYPKEIYTFWFVDFVLGIDLVGAVLLVFFRDWGGLTQTMTQTIQSWFTFWVFALEIPTGVFGDVQGKKCSVITGYILYTIGTITYTLYPNIYLFLLSEFILALGLAFVSGAKEAWLFDTTKRYEIEKEYREIAVIGSALHMVAMILASAVYIFLSKYLSVQIIFRLDAVFSVIAVIALNFIPSTDGKRDGLKPKYLETAKMDFSILKSNVNLKRIAIYISILCATSYFVIWLYQEALRVLSIPDQSFGTYRIVLLVSEIITMYGVARLMRKMEKQKASILIAIVVGIGFIVAGITGSTLGIVILLILSGGLGLQVPTLLSKEINDEIPNSEQRATVLSFVSMIRRLVLTIFNPLIGLLVDSKGVFITFCILGILSLLAVFFKPKILNK